MTLPPVTINGERFPADWRELPGEMVQPLTGAPLPFADAVILRDFTVTRSKSVDRDDRDVKAVRL